MKDAPVIVWFRLDLRLADNPALHAALTSNRPVVPLFIHSPEHEGEWKPGGASNWWLHQSLKALSTSLNSLGSKLILRSGPANIVLSEVIRETGAQSVFWNRRYEPAITARDTVIKQDLKESGIEVQSFNSNLLNEPWTIANKAGTPFKVFTPFWKTCLTFPEPATPLAAPKSLLNPAAWPSSLRLADFNLEPRIPWAEGMRKAWEPGEAGAAFRVKEFLAEVFLNYSETRNLPDRVGTSRLSPHLHFGEISPRQIVHALKRFAERRGLAPTQWRQSQFLAEIGWREFAHHLLHYFPATVDKPLRPEFERFPWREDAAWLRAWQRGMTGYPIVDAGMRELWATGWMHNRVRMIAASFLVKDLMIAWQHGARWFWDTLVDADLASNTLGWQWTAGCGADAAPYFRVFNPTTQGEKFDPAGAYVRKWVPELAGLPDKWIHRPAEAPVEELRKASVTLGKSYPEPIVSHAIAREVALEAFASLKNS